MRFPIGQRVVRHGLHPETDASVGAGHEGTIVAYEDAHGFSYIMVKWDGHKYALGYVDVGYELETQLFWSNVWEPLTTDEWEGELELL